MNAPAHTTESPISEREFAYTDADYRRIAAMIAADAGIALGDGKSALVYGRLARRVRALGLESFRAYCDFLESPEAREERRELLSALTTNVTRFFRESRHFEQLRLRVLPALLHAARQGKRIRIWSAGCSTGEEAYSIAFLMLALEPAANRLDVRVLATDIDPRVLAVGRRGVYSEESVHEIPEPLRNIGFDRNSTSDSTCQVAEAAKTLVSFRELNLHGDWPMRGSFQIIFCRNVVIYFDEAAQQILWRRFAEKLTPGGWLFIGHSERVTGPALASLRPSGMTSYQRSPAGAP